MRSTKGFSLIEILIVLLIIAVAMGLGSSALQSFLNRTKLIEAQSQLAQELVLARNNARKSSLDQEVSWNLKKNEIVVAGVKLSLPSGVSLGEVNYNEASKFVFTAPHGRIEGDNAEFVLRDASKRRVSVRLVGVTGKVVRDD